MSIFEAILFGLLQGATEFLPISSSGHLALAHYFFGAQEAELAFDVALHLGTLGGVIIYFFEDFFLLTKATLFFKDKSPEFVRLRSMALAITVGTIPGVCAGLFLGDISEQYFRTPAMVAASLAGFGLLLLLADKSGKRSRGFESISLFDALVIGICQGFAIFPGVSRSGITITGGLFLGLNRQSAVRFSFLLSAPVILGAGIYKIPDIITHGLTSGNLAPYLAGFIASAISGYLFIAFLMRFIKARSFAIFSYYRFLVAAAILATLFLG